MRLALFVLPLALDTFAVSAALGVAGVDARRRLRLSLLLSGFEAAMPVVGLFAGRGVGSAIGSVADYVAAAVLVALAVWMIVGDEDDVVRADVGGFALVGLGLSVSLDELAVGFSFGLLRVSLVLAVILIGVQAFVAAQLGLRLGARLGATARERAEQLAGVALLALAAVILAARIS